MHRALSVLFAVAAVLVAAAATAGNAIVLGNRVELQSKIMGETRTLLISTPNGYENGDARYPVLIMTDGDAHLAHTFGTVEFLARAAGSMPNLIVVGITNTDRTRDLSPTHATARDRDGNPVDIPNSGGGERFLRFVTDEVVPYVDANYRTTPYRILAGHSLGGLFALHALFSKPDSFNAYIAVSPALRWDDEWPLRRAKEFFADRTVLPATLFVTMANEEDGDPRPNRFDRFVEFVSNQHPKGFTFQSMSFPDETHGSVVLRSHYWGLKTVFADWRLPRDRRTGMVEGGLNGVLKHYQGLSKRYGYQIAPSEPEINQLGYAALGNGADKEALDMFHYNVEHFPNSANVYDSLGEALERQGSLDEALKNYTHAAKLGKKNGDRNAAVFEKNRARLADKLTAEPTK